MYSKLLNKKYYSITYGLYAFGVLGDRIDPQGFFSF